MTENALTPDGASQNGRDRHGRFTNGHPAWKGAGRPPKKREEKYLEHFKKAATPQRFQAATKRLLAECFVCLQSSHSAVGKRAALAEARPGTGS